MREIKFRSYHESTKTMVYSSPTWSDSSSIHGWIATMFEGCHPDNLSPLMQFTGLKDKNGKEIYEGDVIKFSRYWSDHFEVGTGNVFFFEDEAVYLYTHGPKVIEFPTLGEISKEVEIIGNIYENPELVSNEQ